MGLKPKTNEAGEKHRVHEILLGMCAQKDKKRKKCCLVGFFLFCFARSQSVKWHYLN